MRSSKTTRTARRRRAGCSGRRSRLRVVDAASERPDDDVVAHARAQSVQRRGHAGVRSLRLGEFRPLRVLPVFADWLARHKPAPDRRDKVINLVAPHILSNIADAVKRTPYFCSGCPHNTSTKVPEGSVVQAGIGCHLMASWMERDTTGFIQMGVECVDWASHSMFRSRKHRMCFRISATARISTPAFSRSGRPSRRRPTSRTRSSITMPSR